MSDTAATISSGRQDRTKKQSIYLKKQPHKKNNKCISSIPKRKRSLSDHSQHVDFAKAHFFSSLLVYYFGLNI